MPDRQQQSEPRIVSVNFGNSRILERVAASFPPVDHRQKLLMPSSGIFSHYFFDFFFDAGFLLDGFEDFLPLAAFAVVFFAVADFPDFFLPKI